MLPATLTLRFPEKSLEKEYLQWRLPMDARFLKYISLIVLLIQLSYIIRDVVTPNNFNIISKQIRLFYLAPLFLIAFLALLFIRKIRTDLRLFFSISVLLIFSLYASQLAFGILDRQLLLSLASGLTIMFFCIFLFSGLRFFIHLFYTPIVLLAALAIVFNTPFNGSKIDLAIIITVGFALSVAAGYFTELRSRMLFIQHKELHEKSETIFQESVFKSTLLGLLAHDIKSPMINLSSLIHLINSGKITTEEAIALLPTLSGDFNNINDMIDRMLMWVKSQFDGIQLKHEPFNLAELVNQNFQFVATEATKKGIVLKNNLSNSVVIRGDAEITNIILRNLITNSVKYCRQGDCIEVIVEEQPQCYKIVCRDTGKGFDPTQLENMNNASFSTPGTNNEKGFGLGLQICKDLSRLLQTSLDIQSKPGKETSVSFGILKSYSLQ